MKLTEMHLDDWTIAKLLGTSSVRNVKYYRKMSNQLLADETRKARQRLSAVILDNLDGWEQSMNKYDKMIACNRKASAEKIDLARRTIFEMVEEGEKVTIPKLIAKTGLSREFFYKNPMVRQALDKALEQQVGMIDPRRSVLDMAMDNEIVALHERIRELQQENQRLRAENEKMQKALSRRTTSCSVIYNRIIHSSSEPEAPGSMERNATV